MPYVLSAVLSYLLGCSNMALYLGKWKQVDLTAGGSGNYGASNAAILLGWRAGILTGIHDIGKGALAVLLAGLLFPQLDHGPYVAGAACVLGHIFPFYTGFRGGKGFAAYLGMTVALNWKFALVLMALVVLVTWITDYIVWGTALAVVAVPVFMGLAVKDVGTALILAVATPVILYKHLPNFRRIFQGTEIGLRSTVKGEHKIKKAPDA